MKTYAITIQPLSPFGTPLKGDTLFGHFCWQCATDPNILSIQLDDAVADYPVKPFAIFSSAFPLLPDGGYALKRPDAPMELLFDFSGKSKEEILDSRKQLKGKKWLICRQPDGLKELRKCSFCNDDELAGQFGLDYDRLLLTEAELSHNSINRLTGTTGDGFAPFTQDCQIYAPGCTLVIFVAIDEEILSVESLKIGLERIGTFGFGRDASTGLGKFKLLDCKLLNLKEIGATDANALYTLAPAAVPDAGLYRDALFTPFTRFGRHGDRLAVSGKPFKNPVIMADEGALLFPHDMIAAQTRPYIGTAVTGISKIQENAVHQGYSLYIPVRLEVN